MGAQDNGAVKDLTVGEPARLIFYFTLPLLAGNVFQQLFGFVDTLIVGRFLGVEALAAVGCTGPLMFLMLGFVGGMTSGFSICTGQSFGAKDFDGIRYSVVVCTVLALILSVILAIIGVTWCRELLEIMQTPPEISAQLKSLDIFHLLSAIYLRMNLMVSSLITLSLRS